MKTFDALPRWARATLTGADPEPTPPPGNPPAPTPPPAPTTDPPAPQQVVALTPAEMSELVGGIMTQLGAATTDAEKAKLQQDLADAQRIIQENADATATAAEKAKREHNRTLTEAQKKATDGEKAVAHATALGIKYAIEHFKDKDGKTVYEWEDTDTVYELLDKASVKYDLDKGEAAGLDKALEALAKAKPFLLKNKGNPQPQQYAPPGSWPQVIGTPPGAPNTGASPAGKTVDDYAAMPAYRAAFGRLKGLPTTIPVPQAAVNPQQ